MLTWSAFRFRYNIIYYGFVTAIWFIRNKNSITAIAHTDFSAAGDYITKYSGFEHKLCCVGIRLCRYYIIVRPEGLCKEKMVVEDIEDGLFICIDVGGKWYVFVRPSISGFFLYVNFH